MQQIKFWNLIRSSIGRTKNLLLEPFSLKKWLSLLLISLLAGTLPLGGGIGLPKNLQDNPNLAPARQLIRSWFQNPFSLDTIGVVVLIVVASLLFLWVACRFQWVWFHAIATGEASIVEPFHRHFRQAVSLFKLKVVLSSFFIGGYVLFLWWFYVIADKAGVYRGAFEWTTELMLRQFGMPLFWTLLFVFLNLMISTIIDQFVVPQMALDQADFFPSLEKVLHLFKKHLATIGFYYLTLFFLILPLFLLSLALLLLLAVIAILAATLLFGPAYLLLKTSPGMAIYSMVIGTPFIFLVLLGYLGIKLPIATFGRVYSLQFLGALEPSFGSEAMEAYAARRTQEQSIASVVTTLVISAILFLFIILGVLVVIAIPRMVASPLAV